MTNRQTIFRWALLILSGIACLLVFAPFTVEILSAAFFAFALFPVTQKLRASKHFRRKGWVAVILALFILAVITPLVLLGFSFFQLFNSLTSEGFQKTDLFEDLNRSRDFAMQILQSLSKKLGLQDSMNLGTFINQMISGIGNKLMSASTAIVAKLPNYGLSLFIFCCALYLFLAEGKQIRFLLMHNKFLPAHDLNRLIPLIQRACYATLVGSLMVAVVQASVVTLGSAILASSNQMLIFLVTFVCSFIPVIGAAPVALFLALIALIKDQTSVAIGYVVVAVVAGTVDNLIRPFLVRGEENIHPVIMLLAILGAILLFGIPGLFLGPMFIVATVEIYSLYVLEGSDSIPLDESES